MPVNYWFEVFHFAACFKNMRELLIIQAAILKKDPINLSFASERLKDNESIVYEAVRKDEKALTFASSRQRDN